MIKLLEKLKNSKRGFSLVELIVVIAIMAVIAAVLVPSLLMHVEESRAEKDVKTTDEVVTAVELALADQDVYDELVEHSVFDNVSCYVDKDSESGFEKTVIKETYNGHAEQYMFDDNARQNDEVPYFGAGNMRGLTITFSPEKNSNESSYDLSHGIINRFVGRKTGYLYENEKLYNAIRSVVGDKIYNSSQTYRNSDFTIFIRLGSAGGNEAGNQDATQVWGQYNGTNLPADAVQTAKITTDRAIGDAGQYDQAVNDYINDEANTDIDFSQLAQMGNSNFGEKLESNSGNIIPEGGTYKSLSRTYNAGDKFPKTMMTNDIYTYGDYEYTLVDAQVSEYAFIDYFKSEYGITTDEEWQAFLDSAGITEEQLIQMGYEMGSIGDSKGHFEVSGGSGGHRQSSFGEMLKTINGVSVTSIGYAAFQLYKNLTSITIPDGVTEIGDAAFDNCEKLTSITIPDSVTRIGSSAFDDCRKLTSITIPIGVTEIEGNTFWQCESLTTMTIPYSVKTIGPMAFAGCTNLTLKVPSTVTIINGAVNLENDCKEVIYY